MLRPARHRLPRRPDHGALAVRPPGAADRARGGASGGRRRPYAIVAGLVASFTVVHARRRRRCSTRSGCRRTCCGTSAIVLLFVVAATLALDRASPTSLERPFYVADAPPADRQRGGGFVLGVDARARLRAVRRAGARGGHACSPRTATSASRRSRSRSPTRSAPPCRCSRSPSAGGASRRRCARGCRGSGPSLGGVVALTALAIALGADQRFQTARARLHRGVPGADRAQRAPPTASSASSTGVRASDGVASGGCADYGPAPEFARDRAAG